MSDTSQSLSKPSGGEKRTQAKSIVPGENNAPAKPAKRAASEILLKQAQGSAIRRYAAAIETITTATTPGKRLGASDDIRQANMAISPEQRAIITWFVKGNDLADLAAKTGRATSELKEMLLTALDRLAAHYAQVEV